MIDQQNPALQQILAALTARGLSYQLNGEAYEAQCPSHDDDNPSLTITQNNGRVLISCYAGCSLHLILAELGLTVDDLFDKSVTS